MMQISLHAQRKIEDQTYKQAFEKLEKEGGN